MRFGHGIVLGIVLGAGGYWVFQQYRARQAAG